MKSLVIDAGLLVLFVVGTTSKSYIAKHKRLRTYTVEDYDLLCEVISGYQEIVVTPNSLTEASNWLAYINEPMRAEVFTVFGSLIPKMAECYVASKTAVTLPEFIRLGLTDTALLSVCDGERVLVTEDFDLYRHAVENDAATLNFNHLREARGLV